MRIRKPSEKALTVAAELLHAGHIVAYPTETVYGLAVDPYSETALDRLWAAKGRDASNPVLLLVANMDQLRRVVRTVSPRAEWFITHFWPGPLTLLFEKADDIPDRVSGGLSKIAVRCSSHPVARRLCEAFGGPITSTSANRSGEAPVADPKDFNLPGVELLLDAGCLMPSAPSTVYDPDDDRIVRRGAVTEEMIRECAAGFDTRTHSG